MPNRWWTYQSERFPVLRTGLLIAAFSFCAVSYSALLRGELAPPSFAQAFVAFACLFIFFLMLRIADEFKDFEEDLRYRPYRPVQRGLVTLRELGTIAVAGAVIQLCLCLWLEPRLAKLILVPWVYLGLMSKEFFFRDWLKARPITYLWTHMLIMPLVDLFATGCDWLVAGLAVPTPGLIWFLLASFFNGIVIEFGRKIRAPEDEEHGVDTYTFLWGRRNAVLVWLGALGAAALFACLAAARIDFLTPLAAALALFLSGAGALGFAFLKNPATKLAKRIEDVSGLWVLMMYLGLGAVPLLIRLAGAGE